jgi:hypothetical protein
MENKLYILWGVCRMCKNNFERRYATQRGVKRAYAHAEKRRRWGRWGRSQVWWMGKRMPCCTNGPYTIGWAYDFAQEAILKRDNKEMSK